MPSRTQTPPDTSLANKNPVQDFSSPSTGGKTFVLSGTKAAILVIYFTPRTTPPAAPPRE